MDKPIPSCRYCERRTSECHATCEEYKEYVKANAAYKAENKRIEIRDYIRDRISNGKKKTWHK